MKSPDMYEAVFMTNKGDEEKLYVLFQDEIEAAYWAEDTARQFDWSLIDVSLYNEYGKEEVFSK
tara:strand:+ start:197 stop:388 length:192 start_codon:yes stop_codon:yes gene_type:complete